jgi:hypothetical protein
MNLKTFHEFVGKNWEDILHLSQLNKLVIVYVDRLEGLN